MKVVATISTWLFCLSVELTNKDSSSIPAWWVPLLASLFHATVIRPLAVATRHWFGGQTCSTWLRRVPSKVTSQVLRILLSEQTSLWLLYLMAPHLFDINVKLKVQVGMFLVMLRLLLNNTARLLLRLVTGLRVNTSSTHQDDAAAPAAAAATDGGGSLVREKEKMGREGRPGIEGPASGWRAQNGTSGSVGDLAT